MHQLTVELGHRSYPIYIGKDILSATEVWNSLITSAQVLIVTNKTIELLYSGQVLQAFAGKNPETFIIPEGEKYKNLGVMNDIITRLLQLGFNRDCCIIALGGGVIGDITGFSAACYQRGVRYIQIPTTLLAQVDSSVGGKTAVNHELGKNMIGAFHQPAAVISDISVLDSLPDRELSAGLAEVIKYGLIRDSDFFLWLDNNMEGLVARKPECLLYALERSCVNKAEVVADDERETGARAILNLGHTFGHAIETAQLYQGWLHGEAVAAGMLMAAEMSFRLGWLAEESILRIKSLLERAGLPVTLPDAIRGSGLRQIMAIDKKAKNGRLYLVLLKEIGRAVLTDEYDDNILDRTLADFPAISGVN